MNSSQTIPDSTVKRGRGRPKGSRNKPKHHAPTRRNAPRLASYNPIRDMPELSLPAYNEEFASGHRFRLGTDAPPYEGWVDVAAMAALIKIVIAPHVKKWSKSHRYFAGAALMDCIYDLIDAEGELPCHSPLTLQRTRSTSKPFKPAIDEEAVMVLREGSPTAFLAW
ncbi:hypothetical protein A4X13_0g8886 [Tilletia indica]|uniref:Uncharacterized protein n=1 Tax=Tilletia indica TaxID=43049 RepID=A0A8T8SCI0_9BASI|nr:hypothetical protein A4X13_0g8886 [Tilletia indica]